MKEKTMRAAMLPLTKTFVDSYVDMILKAGYDGMPMEQFLRVNAIRKSDWDEFVKKHKKIRTAITDASHFATGYALSRVNELMKDKNINSHIAKMYLENCAGWTRYEDLTKQVPPTVTIKLGKTTKED